MQPIYRPDAHGVRVLEPPELMAEGSATLLEYLVPERDRPSQHKCGQETWNCAWSPDNFYFGWSSGNSTVKLIPWNRFRHCMLARDGTDLAGDEISLPKLLIRASELVWGLAFGLRDTKQSQHAVPQPAHDLLLALGLDSGTIEIWHVIPSTSFKAAIITINAHNMVTRDLKFSPDGTDRLLSASRDGALKVWDLRQWREGKVAKLGECRQSSEVDTQWYYSCAWSPDARMVCGAGQTTSRNMEVIILWDLKTGKQHILEGHDNLVTGCDFSPDGSLLATSSLDGTVLFWDVYGRMELFQLQAVEGPSVPVRRWPMIESLRGVALSPDGRHVVTVVEEKHFKVWDMQNLDQPIQKAGLYSAVCSAFSPNGAVLSVGNRNGEVSFWLMPVEVSSLQHLCRMALRRVLPSTDACHLKLPPKIRRYLMYMDYFPGKEFLGQFTLSYQVDSEGNVTEVRPEDLEDGPSEDGEDSDDSDEDEDEEEKKENSAAGPL